MIAGTVTGSVAILTEAVHSSIDLVASIVAFFSVRKADEPADESHRYGHEKIENLAAAIEGILILVGSAAIAFEAIRRLVGDGQRAYARRSASGWSAFSMVVNVVVSARDRAQRAGDRLAGARGRRRAPAHRRDDLGGRAASGWCWSRSPARTGSTRPSRWSSRPRSWSPGCGC